MPVCMSYIGQFFMCEEEWQYPHAALRALAALMKVLTFSCLAFLREFLNCIGDSFQRYNLFTGAGLRTRSHSYPPRSARLYCGALFSASEHFVRHDLTSFL
jgi:hypothetical protein